MIKKNISIKIILLLSFMLAIVGWFVVELITMKWRHEEYILEGAGYSFMLRNVESEKEHKVAGEKINLSVLPQGDPDPGNYDYQQSTGPYKLSVSFEKGVYGDGKKIIIHDVKVQSEKGKLFELTDQFPKVIEPESYYTEFTSKGYKPKELIIGETEVYYRYLFDTLFNFNFKNREKILVNLDIEVIRKGNSEREKISLRLIPILDRGRTIMFPSV